jgi:hypothetical protein
MILLKLHIFLQGMAAGVVGESKLTFGGEMHEMERSKEY